MKKKDQEAIANLYTESWYGGDGDRLPRGDMDGGDYEENRGEIEYNKKFANVLATLRENLELVQNNLHKIMPNTLDVEKIDRLISELLPEVSLIGRGSAESIIKGTWSRRHDNR